MKLGCCRSLHIAFVGTDCEAKFKAVSARELTLPMLFPRNKAHERFTETEIKLPRGFVPEKNFSEQRVAFGKTLALQPSEKSAYGSRGDG